MATFTPSAGGSSGATSIAARNQGSSWASIVSGQPSRSHLPPGLRGQRTGSSTNLTEGRYHSALTNAFNSQSKLSALPTSVPSYLEDSLYAEKLAAARRPQKVMTVGPPTRNQSATSLAKLGQSRGSGLKLDMKDGSTSSDDDLPSPLPTKWNDRDKSAGIDISQDGQDVQFFGSGKVNEYDSAAVRADHFMPRSCGIYYYEVTIMQKSREGLIGIGFCAADVLLNRLPGWEPNSWGYHGDDGKSFCCSGVGKQYGPQFNTKDVIGCGVNFRTNSAFFTRNGHPLGIAFRDLPTDRSLYPAVGMKKPGEHIRVNFGQEDFSFDIDGYMKAERARAYEEINDAPTDRLYPSLSETALIQSLIATYLQHDGFVETAQAFANDLQAEQNALNSGRSQPMQPVELLEDKDAVNRQNIRAAILDGNIDRALELMKQHYPQVLVQNQQINFRLRCRKFIEMMRLSAEQSNGTYKKAPTSKSASKNSGRTFDAYEDDDDVDVEMDDENEEGFEDDEDAHGDSKSDWAMEEDGDEYANGYHANDQKDLLTKVVEYGMQLQEDFKNSYIFREELEAAFSLFAYSDPINSPVAHLLSVDGRLPVAEALNSAILVSLGKSSKAPLERLVQQTTVFLRELGDDGGPAAFVNVQNWITSPDSLSSG